MAVGAVVVRAAVVVKRAPIRYHSVQSVETTAAYARQKSADFALTPRTRVCNYFCLWGETVSP
jgi:hypothetical protein